MKRSAILFATAVIAAGLVATASTASLARGTELATVVGESTPLPADATPHTVAARCPQGTSLTGGGIGFDQDPTAFNVGMYPAGRTFEAQGYRSEPADEPSDVTAYALCLAGAKVKRAGASVDNPPQTGNTAFAQCPSGTKPAGGGVKLSDPSAQLLTSSHPLGGRWRAQVTNTGDSTATFTAYALCVDKEIRFIEKSTTKVPSDRARYVTASAQCPRGSTLTGGGGGFGGGYGSFSDRSADNLLLGNYPGFHRNWVTLVRGYPYLGPYDVDIVAKSFAICVRT